MNRVIRFRGMTLNGIWVDGNLAVTKVQILGVEKGTYISNDVGRPFAYQVRPETIGQYTDAYTEDIEVCEGDTVKFKYKDIEYVGVVRFEATMFIVCSNNLPDNYISLFELCELDGETNWFKGEVIGNVYTNTIEYKAIKD